MNILCKRLLKENVLLIGVMMLSLVAGALRPDTVHAGGYIDLRRIEPIHGDVTLGAAKTAVCVACHGPAGNATVPQFPRLAGQRADYIYYRLVEFKAVTPKDPDYASSPMPAQVQNLSDQDMRNIAAYFAAQALIVPVPPPPAVVDGKGEALYLGGDPSRGVPPCQGCHGPNALGGPVESGRQYLTYPLLRGQHAAYLVSRLSHFRDRPAVTSNDFIMSGVVATLDDGSIQSLAAWLESLAP